MSRMPSACLGTMMSSKSGVSWCAMVGVTVGMEGGGAEPLGPAAPATTEGAGHTCPAACARVAADGPGAGGAGGAGGAPAGKSADAAI